MANYHSQTAYWLAYQAAITGKAKPSTSKYQTDVDNGWNDGKADLHRQLLTTLDEGATVQ